MLSMSSSSRKRTCCESAYFILISFRNWNTTEPIAEGLATQNKITFDWIPQLAALAPESGCYLNEVGAAS